MNYLFCPSCGNKFDSRRQKKATHQHCLNCHHTLYRNPTVGVAVVLIESDHLLLVKRNGSYSGKWCIPCGHVEWNEDIRKAAIREFKEETGLQVTVGPVLTALSNFHDPAHQTAGIWFWGMRTGGVLNPGTDASDAEFFPLSGIPQDMAFPTDVLVCNALKKGVRSGALRQWLTFAAQMEGCFSLPPKN